MMLECMTFPLLLCLLIYVILFYSLCLNYYIFSQLYFVFLTLWDSLYSSVILLILIK